MKLEDATILLVDDELELLEIFAKWLNRGGCRVLTAANGVEALKVLKSEHVDSLISDLQMPVMDGLTLVRRIYEMKTMIPSILFVSGVRDVRPREMYALGVEALIEKPLTRKTLVDALESSLRDRNELWLTPSTRPVARSILVDLDSINGSAGQRCFGLGRGGCCITTGQGLMEKETINLTVRFVREDLTLKAQGTVCWYNLGEGCAGVAFHYLDPACRAWVVEAINRAQPRSFIPHC